MKKLMGDAKGFTLIEVMIVIAIIGILAAIAIPQFQNFSNKSKRSEAMNVLQAIYTAEVAYVGSFDKYVGESVMSPAEQAMVLAKLGLEGLQNDMKFYNQPQDGCTTGNCLEMRVFQGFMARVSGSLDKDFMPDVLIIRSNDYSDPASVYLTCPSGAPYIYVDDITNAVHPCL